MTKLNQILLTVAVAGTFTLASSASAQYRTVSDDGIAASPKVRQMLDERQRSKNVALAFHPAHYPAAVGDGIAASPKVRMVLNEQKRNTAVIPPSTAVAGYRAVGADGIAASPKLRQQLDERNVPITVAPVK